jgi:hypothetical protein
MARKTVGVTELRDDVNRAIAALAEWEDGPHNNRQPHETPAYLRGERQGMASVLEMVLSRSGNYRGFSYLPSEWDEAAWALKPDYDRTRRRYS